MNGVLSATRLMKAREIIEKCAELRNHPTLLLVIELEAKKRLYEINYKS
ncbi:hypothetical protein ACT4US_20025 [Bacillus sp. HC-Mk]|nr:hypothetical protein [Bacillus sp. GeD10]CCW08692.1 hypothetical protein EBGED10_54370 [Bacillus sp. GeD10]